MDHKTSFGNVLYVRTDVTGQTSTGWLWVTVLTLFRCGRQLWLLFFFLAFIHRTDRDMTGSQMRERVSDMQQRAPDYFCSSFSPWEATTEGWKNDPSGGWRKNGIMVVGRCVRCVSWIKHIQFKVWPVSNTFNHACACHGVVYDMCGY